MFIPISFNAFFLHLSLHACSGEMQNLLSSFGADLSRNLTAKKSRMENYTQLAVKTSSKKVREMWQAQQIERQAGTSCTMLLLSLV